MLYSEKTGLRNIFEPTFGERVEINVAIVFYFQREVRAFFIIFFVLRLYGTLFYSLEII
jgi:hypothetical protein